jgi:hypothetical protein
VGIDESEKLQWAALAEILDHIIEGRVGMTAGCRAVVNRYWQLERENSLFNPFRGFDSESAAFPLGEVRQQWAASSLKEVDAERVHTEAHYRDWVFEAARRLRSYAREKCA